MTTYKLKSVGRKPREGQLGSLLNGSQGQNQSISQAELSSGDSWEEPASKFIQVLSRI